MNDLARPNSYYLIFVFFLFIIITAFIDTHDLGQALQRTQAGTGLGKNFVLGLCITLMALTFDTLLLSWAQAKKKVPGLD